MRIIRKTRDPEPAQPAEQEPALAAEPVDETTAAAQTRTAADAARAEAHQARAEADTLVDTARAQAARLIAEAEQTANDLRNTARTTDRHAQELDARAQLFTDALTWRGRIDDAEQRVAAVVGERSTLTQQVAALTGRLDELAAQREDTTAALTAAREAGDVAAVQGLRAQLAAVDEVAAVLARQREAAQERLLAIGEAQGPGELSQALTALQDAQDGLRRVHNLIDPDRPEARYDAALAEFNATAAVQIAAAENAPARAPTVQTITRPDGTAAHAITPRS